MSRIFFLFHKDNIFCFERKFYEVYSELLKEFIAILNGDFLVTDTTQAIDTAMSCLCNWIDIISFNLYYITLMQRIPLVMDELTKCRDDLYFLYHRYQKLKENKQYYDKQYCVGPKKEEEETPQGYFRVKGIGPFYYCIELDKLYSPEEAYKKVAVGTILDMWEYVDLLIKGKDGKYHEHTCAWVSVRCSTNFDFLKSFNPDAKFHRGKDGYRFYKKYFMSKYGPDFDAKLCKMNFTNNVADGKESFINTRNKKIMINGGKHNV
ncbi:hypothetical protein [Enterocloster bolteae]|uniref:hypothetical protein n=1 Tax=Enterocloster bolteae TaxID=208479 RepID=UPI00210F0F5A|nr:hypothetical protein [Enterocloster bolteae]MCQ5144338.1 hypothetical protein [Enterocloster bolteae]